MGIVVEWAYLSFLSSIRPLLYLLKRRLEYRETATLTFLRKEKAVQELVIGVVGNQKLINLLVKAEFFCCRVPCPFEPGPLRKAIAWFHLARRLLLGIQ